MDLYTNLLLGFLLGLLSSYLSLPLVLKIAKEKNLFDIPDERKVHEFGIPRLGGLVFVPSLIMCVSLVIGINIELPHFHLPSSQSLFFNLIREVPMVLVGILMTYIIGVADDLIDISYKTKFAVQFSSAAMLVINGIYFRELFGLFGVGHIHIILGIALSILLVMFIMNAINLVDGVDGLSSIITGLALVYYSVIFYIKGQYLICLIATVLLGVLIPFYVHNVFGDPMKHQKIFMGDTGTLTIGFLLASFALDIAGNENNLALGMYNPLVVSLVPLLLPCMDVLRVFGVRILSGKNPFLGDRNHLHHILLSVGFSKFGVSLFFVLYTIIIGGLTLYLSMSINSTWLLLANFGLYFLVILLLQKLVARKTIQ